jgi:hypothetical protein
MLGHGGPQCRRLLEGRTVISVVQHN